MTTILVATDFSANAHWATDYALELARQVEARLVLIHAYDPFPNLTMPPLWMIPKAQELYQQALQQLITLQNELLARTNFPVDISVVARPGSPITCLIDEAANQKADLLVMSLVGNEPLRVRQLGSLATQLIPLANVSMLLVPPGAAYHKPQHMVLAVDLSKPVDTHALLGAKRFSQLLNAKLDVICMEDEPDALLRKAAKGVCTLLTDQLNTFRFWPGYDLTILLDEYVAENETDLIMLLPRPHNWLRTWLLESNTQEVARLATVPVLAAI